MHRLFTYTMMLQTPKPGPLSKPRFTCAPRTQRPPPSHHLPGNTDGFSDASSVTYSTSLFVILSHQGST